MTLLSGNANCIKYVLFLFTFLFVLTGVILISVGVTVAAAFDTYQPFLDNKFFSIPTFLIVIGSFIFIIAFLGCCGALKENYCMIASFSALLIIIFIFELAAGISGYVLRNDTEELLEKKLMETMPTYTETTKNRETTVLWDYVQTEFECCGVKNVTDWENALKGSIPMSCCKIEPGTVNSTTCANIDDNHSLYRKGCLDRLTDYISSHAVSLGAAGIFLALFQFAGIFFSCYVAREIKIKNGGVGLF